MSNHTRFWTCLYLFCVKWHLFFKPIFTHFMSNDTRFFIHLYPFCVEWHPFFHPSIPVLCQMMPVFSPVFTCFMLNDTCFFLSVCTHFVSNDTRFFACLYPFHTHFFTHTYPFLPFFFYPPLPVFLPVFCSIIPGFLPGILPIKPGTIFSQCGPALTGSESNGVFVTGGKRGVVVGAEMWLTLVLCWKERRVVHSGDGTWWGRSGFDWGCGSLWKVLVFALSFGSHWYLHEKWVSNAVLVVETRCALVVCDLQRLRLRQARHAWVAWYTFIVVRVLLLVHCCSCDWFYSPSHLLFMVWKLNNTDVVESLVALGCLSAVVVNTCRLVVRGSTAWWFGCGKWVVRWQRVGSERKWTG